MTDVLLIQVAIADYRNHFIALLKTSLPGLRVQVGREYFEETTRTSQLVASLAISAEIQNRFFLGRRLCWQRLRWSEALAAEVVVAELNPRLLSTWVLLVLRRVRRRRTVLWGHAWSRAGSGSRTEVVRHGMRRLADGLLFYTESQLAEFQAAYPDSKIPAFVAPNSLYLSSEMGLAVLPAVPQDFIYVGRLVATKKVELLLEGFAIFAARHPVSTLHIVGTGDQLTDLVVRAAKLCGDRVIFHGHVSDVDELRSLYGGSVASVSPGYVGLSVTQSLSFGVPMIVARDEPHSPEIECVVEGSNGSFFNSDSPEDLCLEMEYWYAERGNRNARGARIVEECRARYSVERMVAGFVRAVA